ncbi:Nuclear fusion protein KAR5 [Grifola frondosa]|uniref:Nuclear fusion protein KAR5 n=1 Tax=Grifola frondosa TaxID=5627 RepID=A0A1C7MPN9_GRIFR|nr:Nuclear fusion protein KAR5 [Grifola frondosa]
MTVFMVFALLNVFLLPHVHAISWTKSSSTIWKADVPLSENQLGLDEIATIFHHADTLETYARKPDCFKRAASLIRTQCGELDLNEDERIKAALSMTLCEIATATHSSAPLECAPFVPDSNYPTIPREQSHRVCVEALSRSAQYWSSYSGYLREVPQLCYAFRRWIDIDTARDIYKNATMENKALLAFVANRETRLQQTYQDTDRMLKEIRDVLQNLQASSSDIDVASNEMAAMLHQGFVKIGDALETLVLDMQKRNEENEKRAISHMNNAFGTAIQEFDTSLSTLLPLFERMLRDQLNQIFSSVAGQHQGIMNLMDTVQSRFAIIEGDFDTMQQSVVHLIAATSQANNQVEAHVQQARIAHDSQVEVSDSAARLAHALSLLTEKMHTEMISINNTALDVKSRLLKGSDARNCDWWTWFKTGVLHCLEIILRVDPAYLDVVSTTICFICTHERTHLVSFCKTIHVQCTSYKSRETSLPTGIFHVGANVSFET